MRILILGGTGMLGHKLVQEFSKTDDLFVTVRPGREHVMSRLGVPLDRVATINANPSDLDTVMEVFRPEVVVNCIGIIKQLPEANCPLVSIPVNALFPHQANSICSSAGATFIHVSTDCVFSGRRMSPYREADAPDAEDMYGRTKTLGETTVPPGITLRTSIIGRELSGSYGLVEWFLGQNGSVRGFDGALYTGLTTIEFARTIREAIRSRLCPGLYHVSSDCISKFELLKTIRKHFCKRIEIIRDNVFKCDRRLDSSIFRSFTGYCPSSWDQMIWEMSRDETPYKEWRKQ